MSGLFDRLPQVLRRAIQLGVLLFIVFAALNGPWRNYKRAHNSARLVGLMQGPTWAELYAANQDLLELIDEEDPMRASYLFLGFPWGARVFGLETADPLMVLSYATSTGSLPLDLLLSLLLPLGLALLLGKVFCSHLCPMRPTFEFGQLVRAGLIRLGIPLPTLRTELRLGRWILLGGVLASLFAGTAVWLFILPYVSLSMGLFLLLSGGLLPPLLLLPLFWFALDVLVAPGYFCHNLCPTGALLESVGRFSLLRLVKRGEEPCPTGCQVCVRVCPYHLSPKEQTHLPACDSCGSCAAVCPSRRLARRLESPLARRLPLLAALLCVIPLQALAPAPALAHHNKGLPHYGYFENYPQVPTEEYVRIDGRWEIGATIFNFQGYERINSDTPNDVKLFLYLYDLEADRSYHGAIDVEIRFEDRIVARFDRLEVDEEDIYSTRETLPESGDYELVALVDGERIRLPFHVELASDQINWWLVGGISLPVLLLFGLALIGRKRRRRAPRRDARADGAGAASLLALLFAGVASLAAPAYAQPELEPAGVRVHAPLQLEGEASREAGDPEAATICPDCGMRECTMDHQAAERGAASAPAEGVVCEHCDMVNCTMEHLETEAGAVMVMGGIPLWLFLVGVGGLILFSFVAVEVVGPSAKPGFRRNLIKNRRLYAIVRSRWFQVVPQLVMILILGALIYAGLVGNQVANITPVLVWTIWWGVLIFAVLVMASAWCFVCPWDGLANLVSRLRLAARIESLSIGAKFPLWLANVYPAIALFVVLTWLELGYGVTTQAQATAYMGLGMIAMAIGGALLWDGKRFCAHFCPVGRICGIYSNFAPIEIRAHKSKACRTCTTEDCLHGNERGYPCPTGISLKVVQDATMCTMCTECIKSCDRQNVAINLRPFGADLSKGIAPKTDEAWLALMLLALTLFHGLSMTPAWESFDPGGMSILKWLGTRFGLGHGPSFSIAMLVAVAIPIGVYWLSCTLAAAWAKEGIGPKRVFVTYAFSLLPVALFYHLAHNLMHVLGEGGAVVPMLSDPLGTGADYLGTRGVHLGHLIDEQTMWALQVGLILIGHVFGVIFAHRFAHRLYEDRKAAIRSLIPMTVMMIAISVAGLYLMHMDMNMRVGRM